MRKIALILFLAIFSFSKDKDVEEEELIGDDKLNKIKSASIKTQVKQVTLIK